MRTIAPRGEVMDVFFHDHHVALAKLLDRGYFFSPERYSIVAAGRVRRSLTKRGQSAANGVADSATGPEPRLRRPSAQLRIKLRSPLEQVYTLDGAPLGTT